jgi:very-short-patch-repair endonuclease
MPRKPGFHHSKATRRKMSLSSKGRVFTDEHRQHLHESHIGAERTDVWRKAVSRALRGKKQSTQHIEARSKALTGRVLSKAHCQVISELKKAWWKDTPKERKETVRRKMMMKWHKVSSLELLVRVELMEHEIKFFAHRYIAGYFPDLYIPSLNLIIEVDGTYWHSTPEARKRDRLKDKAYRKSGYNVARIKECDIKKSVADAVRKAIDL